MRVLVRAAGLALVLGVACTSSVGAHVNLADRADLSTDRTASGFSTNWAEAISQLESTATDPTNQLSFNTDFSDSEQEFSPMSQAGAECGRSVGAGDFDGDGFGDVAISCPMADISGFADVGKTFIYFRNATNTNQCCSISIVQPGTIGAGDAGDECGWSMATGDINQDGLDDIAVGCVSEDVGGFTDVGSVIVYFAQAGRTFSAGTRLADSTQANSACGKSVAIEDIDDNGYPDVMSGCSLFDYQGLVNSGMVDIYFRSAGGFSANSRWGGGSVYEQADSSCGNSVAAHDVNGDDLGDLIIGCSNRDNGGADAGAAIVRYNTTGTTFDTGTILKRATTNVDDQCGTGTAGGDFNADGLGDILIGCQGAEVGADLDSGTSLAFVRNPANTGFILTEFDNSGSSDVKCGIDNEVADVNGDGYDDALTGCLLGNNVANDVGRVQVVTRNAANTGWDDAGGAKGLVLDAPQANDHCGYDLAVADFDRDGRDDVVMGCNTADRGAVDTGAAGTATFEASTPGMSSTGVAAGDQCGLDVDGGDVDGDGFPDLAQGCDDDANGGGAGSKYGVVSVRLRKDIRGSNYTGTGFGGSWELGRSVATRVAGDECGMGFAIGDVNADGRDDVVAGCNKGDVAGVVDTGLALVFTRNIANTGFDPPVELTHPTPAAGDECGEGNGVAIGDVNGDGLGDIALECSGDDLGGPSTNEYGSVVVFLRSGSGWSAGTVLSRTTPTIADACGSSIEIADVNGDDLGDVLMGCPGTDSGGASTNDYGSVVVFIRNGGGFNPGVELLPTAPVVGDRCGYSLAAGDMNADGKADIVAGCRYADPGGSVDAGKAIVFTRNPGNTAFDPQVTLSRPTPVGNEQCGRSVAVADFDADGRDDVLVGCELADLGGAAGADYGSALAYSRNSANNGFDAPYELGMPANKRGAGDHCGSSVGAADVNRDGRADALIGCYLGGIGGFANVAISHAAATFPATQQVTLGTLNRTTPTAIEQATLDTTTMLNGQAVNWEMSANGGTNWQSATPGTPVNFAVTGNDLRARATFTNSSSVKRTAVVNDVNVSYVGNNAPTAPTALSPAAAAVSTTGTPTLQATFNDPDAGEQGYVDFEVCANAACNAVGDPQRSGSSTLITTGSAGSWAPGTALAPGTYYWHVRGRDDGGLTSSWSATRSIRIDALPSATLVSPADTSSWSDTTPDLVARFNDPDGTDTGTIGYEVCTVAFTPAQTCAAAGGSLLASGSSPAGVVENANGTWTAAPALSAGTRYWRARATDSVGGVGAWTSAFTLRVGAASMTVAVDAPSLSLSPSIITPGVDATATTTVTVTTDNATGYVLSATDPSDTDGMVNGVVDSLPDWTGTDAAPTTWAAGTPGYFGVGVLSATGGKNSARWGTGTTATDFANLKYVGLRTTNTWLFQRAGFSAGTDSVVVAYRADVSVAEQAGAYGTTVSFTAVANP